VILGKALGGGLLPVSAFAPPRRHAGVQSGRPRQHVRRQSAGGGGRDERRSTCCSSERLIERAAELGPWLLGELQRSRAHRIVTDVRGRGLFIGIEVDARVIGARPVVDRLLARGILSKDTHGTVIRIAPPLNIPREDLAWASGEIHAVFEDLARDLKRAA
jgi:ornithine--oxo-acid transaminase